MLSSASMRKSRQKSQIQLIPNTEPRAVEALSLERCQHPERMSYRCSAMEADDSPSNQSSSPRGRWRVLRTHPWSHSPGAADGWGADPAHAHPLGGSNIHFWDSLAEGVTPRNNETRTFSV